MQGVLRISEGANLAIHAMSYLNHVPPGETASVGLMATDLNVSRDHLGKVMHRLGRLGLVTARRGPGGGYQLAVPADQVSLLEIVEGIEGSVPPPGCLLGQPVCAPGRCTLSGLARRVHDQIVEVLKNTHLSDLPSPIPAKL